MTGPKPSEQPTVSWHSEAGAGAMRADAMPRIEGYEVLGRLGEGGMGIVCKAVQLSTRREVALKFLASGAFATDKQRHRFEREVELAAGLEHPSIARVYDSGLTHGGYYYAMQLIPGVPLDEYVQSRQLPRRDILRLMRTVCEAVQHAHQRGVIHRDLKPANVLVTQDGQPYVLDFGLAKDVLGPDETRSISSEGGVTGTIAYMSPEQASGKHKGTDTRTDVYSLGVILYRLLTGRYPRAMTGTAYEVLKRIAEEEVIRPRSAMKDMDGDLEALLLKALAHDSARRYGSAGEMAEDIGRYLNGDPLSARAPTTIYFLYKRLRKHWLAASVGLLILVLLMARAPMWVTFAVLSGVTGVSIFAYVRVSRERRRAEEERNRAVEQRRRADEERKRAEEERVKAEKARERATAVTGALQEVLSSVSPDEAKGREVTVREVLDRTASEVGERFAGQPEVEFSLRLTMGETYRALRLPEAAEAQYRAAVDLGERALGPAHPDVLRATDGLVIAMMDEGTRRTETETVLRRALEFRREKLGRDHPSTARALSLLAWLLMYSARSAPRARLEEAAETFREALRIQRTALGEGDPATIDTMEGYGKALHNLSRLEEAEKVFRQALDLSIRTRGEQAIGTVEILDHLSRVLRDLHKCDEAFHMCARVLEYQRRVLGKAHPRTLDAMDSLAGIELLRGRLAEAETIHREAVDMARRELGPEHAQTGASMFGLSRTLAERGKFAEAREIAAKVLNLHERIYGAGSGSALMARDELANALSGLGQHDEAVRILRAGVEARVRKSGAGSLALYRARTYLSEALARMGNYAEAEGLLREVIDARCRAGLHPAMQWWYARRLVGLLESQGRTSEAAKLREEYEYPRRSGAQGTEPAPPAGHGPVGEGGASGEV